MQLKSALTAQLHAQTFSKKLRKAWSSDAVSSFHTHGRITATFSCIKHTQACMTNHINTNRELTLPSISSTYDAHTRPCTHTHTCQRSPAFRCAPPFFMTLSCQCYLLQAHANMLNPYTQTHFASIHTPTRTYEL